MKKIANFILALCIFFSFLPTKLVHADIAPPPPPYGSNIAPDKTSTHVRMAAETVLIEALPNVSEEIPTARVTASFQMQNMGELDESMAVRFPLDLTFDVCSSTSIYQPLQDFKVWINDQPAPITIDRKIPDMGFPWDKEIDCWANFPVDFPKGQDTHIQVSYIQEAGPDNYDVEGMIAYPYVLRTGSEWYDTIGSADITFKAPWELTQDNMADWEFQNSTSKGVIKGNEIHWHFTNFEPEHDISVTIAKPSVWSELMRARRDIAANSEDGEAWGHLGKALKELTLQRRGVYREDYFRESYAAYQKAVNLKPWDADWHFGFAELLYNQVSIPSLLGQPLTDDYERDCLNQLKAALIINPRHGKATKFLVDLTEANPDLIEKYDLGAYLDIARNEIHLTETQSSIQFDTLTAPFITAEASTPSPIDRATITPDENPVPSITPSPSLTIASPTGPAGTPTPVQSNNPGNPGGAAIFMVVLLPILIVIAIFAWIKKGKAPNS